MNEDVKYRLKNVFADVFESTPDRISEEASIDNVPSWDSMQSLVLSTSVEAEFHIQFTDSELVSLDTFRKILAAVEARNNV